MNIILRQCEIILNDDAFHIKRTNTVYSVFFFLQIFRDLNIFPSITDHIYLEAGWEFLTLSGPFPFKWDIE